MSLFAESKWTDHEVETLINLIQAHPVLWHASSVGYKDASSRNAAFTKIARKFSNVSTEEIRKKYRNLRSQYVREVRLRRNRGYGTKWNFYDSLKFLSTGQMNRKDEDDLDALVSEDTQDQLEHIPITTKTEAHSTAVDELEQCPDDYADGYVSFDDGCDYEIERSQQSPLTKRKRLLLDDSSYPIDFDGNQKTRSTVLLMNRPRHMRDEHTVLGEQVANELRALKNKPQLLKSLKCSILQAILDVNKAVGT